MSSVNNTACDALLAQFPEGIQVRFWEARAWLLEKYPAFQEEVDVPARIVAFGLGPGYKGMVASLIPSKTGLKLGLVKSAGFPDPHGLLEGTGKVHRYVVLPADGPADVHGLEELLGLAVAACRERMGN